MSIRSIVKMISIVFFGMVISHFARADYEIDRLMSSYIVAKAEVAQVPSTEDEAKARPYTVQVASYINEKDAVSHLEELKAQVKDQKLRYFPIFVHGQVWYKVCVGEFVTAEDAEGYKKAFVKHTDEPFAVVISLLDRPKADKNGNTPDEDANAKDVAPKKRKSASMSPNDMSISQYRALASTENGEATPFDGSDSSGNELKEVPTFDKSKTVASADDIKKVAATPKAAVKNADIKKEVKQPLNDFYSLQVGSFPSEALAKENIEKLAAKKDAFVQPTTVKGQKWFRVYLGKFKNRKAAEDLQKSLAGQESFIRHVTK
jgi:septal ring-binding cell division protein DamX